MAEYRLSRFAENQIEEILQVSEASFGELTRLRYAALIVTAMQDVADNPHRPTVSWNRTPSRNIGVYHIRDSRERVPDPPGAIKSPRHYLVFRVGDDGIVDMLGFIYDSMLLDRALRRLARRS